MEKQVFNCGFLLYCELVILYSISDFQSAQGTNAFKYAVSSERYAAGIIFYVFNIFGLGLLVYFGIFLLIHGFADRLSGETIGYLYDYVGALALILVFVIMQNGHVSWHLAKFRSAVQSLFSLYPYEENFLISQISKTEFYVDPRAMDILAETLDRYGVDDSLVGDYITAPALASLKEAISVQQRLRTLISDPVFKPFLDRQGGSIDESTSLYRALMRRVARALMLSSKVTDGEYRNIIWEYVGEDSEKLNEMRRKLIARASIFYSNRPSCREKIINDMGWNVRIGRPGPFLPVIVMYLLVMLLALSAVSLMSMPLISHVVGFEVFAENIHIAILRNVLFSFLQVAAIAWGIIPKVWVKPARPNILGLPWKYYVVTAAGSYLYGIIFNGIVFVLLPPNQAPGVHFPGWFMIWAFPLTYPIYTVAISILLDRRLFTCNADLGISRWKDAVTFSTTMVVTNLLLQSWISYFHYRPGGIVWFFLLFSAGIAFIVGFFVPSGSAEYLLRLSGAARGVASETPFNQSIQSKVTGSIRR